MIDDRPVIDQLGELIAEVRREARAEALEGAGLEEQAEQIRATEIEGVGLLTVQRAGALIVEAQARGLEAAAVWWHKRCKPFAGWLAKRAAEVRGEAEARPLKQIERPQVNPAGECPVCGLEVGSTPDCRNCQRYHEAIAAFRPAPDEPAPDTLPTGAPPEDGGST